MYCIIYAVKLIVYVTSSVHIGKNTHVTFFEVAQIAEMVAVVVGRNYKVVGFG